MKKLITALVLIGWGIWLSAPSPVSARSEEEARVNQATVVLNEMMAVPEEGIPEALLRNAYGVAVFPAVIKAGFVLAGRYGRGIMVIRRDNGIWSDPAFATLMGGSVGYQVGAQSSDIVLVFKTRRSIDALSAGKLTLGIDAGIAAGPVGRHAEASTDAQLGAEIYAYSRSRGLFAGIALQGAVLKSDHEANVAFYGTRTITASDILANRVRKAPKIARKFSCVIARYTGAGGCA